MLFRTAHLLARPWPDKKHRMSIRCENRGESLLISELNAGFRPCFPAVLNCYVHIISKKKIITMGYLEFCRSFRVF